MRALLAALLLATATGATAAPTVVVDWGGGADYVSSDQNVRGYDTPIEYGVDLGDGYSGARWYCPFSDDQPLTPLESWNHGPNWRFYGGVMLHSFTNAFEFKWAEIWSAGPFGDQLYYGGPYGSHGWDLRYWKAADFTGVGGGEVTFAPGSRIEILHYQGGDGIPANNSGRVRAVVRDGGQFWISADSGGPSASTSADFVIDDPATASWAPYSPGAPHTLAFDAAGAVFGPHTFTHITAVGYLHTNAEVPPPATNQKAGFTCSRFRVTAEVGPAAPFVVTRLKGHVRFDKTGTDGFVVKGVVSDLPAGFDPRGSSLTIAVGGAGLDFTLDARGHGVAGQSRTWLKVPAGFGGGPVAFMARLKGGQFATTWSDEGVDANATLVGAPLTFAVRLDAGGVAHETPVGVRYNGRAHKRGTFKNLPG